MKLIISLIFAFASGFSLGDIVGRYKEWQEDNEKHDNKDVQD